MGRAGLSIIGLELISLTTGHQHQAQKCTKVTTHWTQNVWEPPGAEEVCQLPELPWEAVSGEQHQHQALQHCQWGQLLLQGPAAGC